MPVRSLTSSVLIWPRRDEVLQAWATKARAETPALLQVGYFGSYGRGDWGVGSDLDVVLILTDSDCPFERRAAQFDLTNLPTRLMCCLHPSRVGKSHRPKGGKALVG